MSGGRAYLEWQRWWSKLSNGDGALVKWGDAKIPCTVLDKEHTKRHVTIQYDDGSADVVHKYRLLPQERDHD